ncbi:MAG: hypothetical protein ACK4TI_00040 [Nitrososphaerales archaeon]
MSLKKARAPRKHRSRKRSRGEWWSELRHGEAILRGLQRFEKEGVKRKPTRKREESKEG